jgi:hypothetical protein
LPRLAVTRRGEMALVAPRRRRRVKTAGGL